MIGFAAAVDDLNFHVLPADLPHAMAHSQFLLPLMFCVDEHDADANQRCPLEPLVNLVCFAIGDQKSHENIVNNFHGQAQLHAANHLLKKKKSGGCLGESILREVLHLVHREFSENPPVHESVSTCGYTENRTAASTRKLATRNAKSRAAEVDFSISG